MKNVLKGYMTCQCTIRPSIYFSLIVKSWSNPFLEQTSQIIYNKITLFKYQGRVPVYRGFNVVFCYKIHSNCDNLQKTTFMFPALQYMPVTYLVWFAHSLIHIAVNIPQYTFLLICYCLKIIYNTHVICQIQSNIVKYSIIHIIFYMQIYTI